MLLDIHRRNDHPDVDVGVLRRDVLGHVDGSGHAPARQKPSGFLPQILVRDDLASDLHHDVAVVDLTVERRGHLRRSCRLLRHCGARLCAARRRLRRGAALSGRA